MRLLALFARPPAAEPAPCGTVKYGPDGGIEVSGYPTDDVLRLFGHISNAAADAAGISFTREGLAGEGR